MNSTYILVIVLVLGFFAYNIFFQMCQVSHQRRAWNYCQIRIMNFWMLEQNLSMLVDIYQTHYIYLFKKFKGRISELENIKDKNIIVYCRSGARSSMASKSLLKMVTM